MTMRLILNNRDDCARVTIGTVFRRGALQSFALARVIVASQVGQKLSLEDVGF
jgi:hypothetical protein